MENVRISIKISLKFASKGSINNIPALVQIMAWHRPGDKPLSEPMMVSLLTHICVTRPQWVNLMRVSVSSFLITVSTRCSGHLLFLIFSHNITDFSRPFVCLPIALRAMFMLAHFYSRRHRLIVRTILSQWCPNVANLWYSFWRRLAIRLS